jgi:phosphoribosylformimino-5-aminoimidazole carboxamide ribotide isomerase
MKIIPVIDLKDGKVVHAKRGLRDQYQPIHTPLCQSPDMNRVIRAFMDLYDFDVFYIADLNALSDQGDHDLLIGKIIAQFPDKEFWIDQGNRSSVSLHTLPENHIPVLGSESFGAEAVRAIKNRCERFILSLDYSFSGALGAKTLFTDSDCWPDSVIIMTLARVGSGQGPDICRLKEFIQTYPNKDFIAAGGIRNKQDLVDLKILGIHQALVASALHSGAICRKEIAQLSAG